MKAIHVIVSGYVQGVSYRAEAQRQATKLGIVGWVRNKPDGSVEIFAEGEEVALRNFLDWCNSGPPRAVVEKISVDWVQPGGGHRNFTRR